MLKCIHFVFILKVYIFCGGKISNVRRLEVSLSKSVLVFQKTNARRVEELITWKELQTNVYKTHDISLVKILEY